MENIKTEKIGIIAAVETEIYSFIKDINIKNSTNIAKVTFIEGYFANKNIVVAISGIGKVSAAICSQIMIDEFNITSLINIGTAGSLQKHLPLDSFVVSKDAVYGDVDVRVLGYKYGEIANINIQYFNADKQLHDKAILACKNIYKNKNVLSGRIFTTDKFSIEPITLNKILNEIGGDCMEMEGAAIAHIAYLNNIPYVIIRHISNYVNEKAEEQYLENHEDASSILKPIIQELLSLI